MGQSEIFDFLAKERLLGNDDFFSSKQIKRAFLEKDLNTNSVRCDCIKLFEFGFFDLNGDYPKKFRIKKAIALKQRKRLSFK